MSRCSAPDAIDGAPRFPETLLRLIQSVPSPKTEPIESKPISRNAATRHVGLNFLKETPIDTITLYGIILVINAIREARHVGKSNLCY